MLYLRPTGYAMSRRSSKKPLTVRPVEHEKRLTSTDLAWALADIAKSFLPEKARPWMYTNIGAGDQVSVIVELLHGYVKSRTELPAELYAHLLAWTDGYQRSRTGDELKELVSGIRVSSRIPELPTRPSDQRPAPRPIRRGLDR